MTPKTVRVWGLLLVFGAGATAYAALQDVATTQATVCAKKVNGQLRVLFERGAACEPTETKMDWTMNGVAAIAVGHGLTSGGTASHPELAIDTSIVQTRIVAACPPGSAIGSIASDGSISCVPASASQVISGFLDFATAPFPFPGQVVTTLPLPPGKWVVWAKADVQNHVNTSGSFGCRIILENDVDKSTESWLYTSQEYGLGGLISFNPQSIALNAVHEFAMHSSVVLQCFTNATTGDTTIPLGLANIKITALRVDSLTNNALQEETR